MSEDCSGQGACKLGRDTHVGGLEGALEYGDRVVLCGNIVETLGTAMRMFSTWTMK